MGGERMSKAAYNVKEGLQEGKTRKKSSETFVAWNVAATKDAGTVKGTTSSSNSLGKDRALKQPRLSNSSPISAGPLLLSSSTPAAVQLCRERKRLGEGKGRHIIASKIDENNAQETRKVKRKKPHFYSSEETEVEKEESNGLSIASGRRQLSSMEDSSMRRYSTNKMMSVTPGNELRNTGGLHADANPMKKVGVEKSKVTFLEQVGLLGKDIKNSSSRRQFLDGHVSQRRCQTSPCMDEEGEDVSTEDFGTHKIVKLQTEQTIHVLDVDNKEDKQIPLDDSEDEEEMEYIIHDASMRERNNCMDLQGTTLEEESAKRRDRRQAQAMRERDRRRRRKEGLPTNFLLVDEYTRKPYGVGIGDWRKELMLLSTNLDPAIGNINQQPEGAVAEIAEWIQHSWEYSSPIKFAYVKEVIARGVTLRRAKIWKKIRNGEKKPEIMSDKTWQSLEKQMKSPATMRKSESCSRANASRVYFGRTGPSGEVGVRQRLRRILRRSPDPEEIRFEMARDKGYGGRFKGDEHGKTRRQEKEDKQILALGVVRRSNPEHYSDGNNNVDYDSEGPPKNERHYEMIENRGDGGIPNNLAGSVSSLSDVQITEHPLVRRMMERLEALEGKKEATMEDISIATNEKVSGANIQEEVQAVEKVMNIDKVEGAEENEIFEGVEETQKLRRLKKMSKEMGKKNEVAKLW